MRHIQRTAKVLGRVTYMETNHRLWLQNQYGRRISTQSVCSFPTPEACKTEWRRDKIERNRQDRVKWEPCLPSSVFQHMHLGDPVIHISLARPHHYLRSQNCIIRWKQCRLSLWGAATIYRRRPCFVARKRFVMEPWIKRHSPLRG